MINEQISSINTDTASEIESLDTSFKNEELNINGMTNDVIKYLTSWVAKIYRLKYPELGLATTELTKILCLLARVIYYRF